MMQAGSQPNLLQQRNGFRFNIRLLAALDEGRHAGILKRRELGQEMVELEDKPDPSIPELRLLILRHLKDILTVEVDRACRGPIEHPDDVEERALSGSGSPDDRDKFASLNLETDAVEHRQLVPAHYKCLTEISNTNHRNQEG